MSLLTKCDVVLQIFAQTICEHDTWGTLYEKTLEYDKVRGLGTQYTCDKKKENKYIQKTHVSLILCLGGQTNSYKSLT